MSIVNVYLSITTLWSNRILDITKRSNKAIILVGLRRILKVSNLYLNVVRNPFLIFQICIRGVI